MSDEGINSIFFLRLLRLFAANQIPVLALRLIPARIARVLGWLTGRGE
jgi:hypothetical protein